MNDRLSFFFSQLQQRLWVKPLISSLLSIGAAILAHLADYYFADISKVTVTTGSLETLLTIISASMLVMAVFAVGAMLSAYASVRGTATPRAFAIVVSDDVSQYALSVFVGAFIFSIIGLIGLMNGLYLEAGRLVMFIMTIVVFVVVILGFVRWVDNIARLGSLGDTINKVEAATAEALRRTTNRLTLTNLDLSADHPRHAIYSQHVGFLQRIDLARLQAIAEKHDLQVQINLMVGGLSLPGNPLAYCYANDAEQAAELPLEEIQQVFVVDKERTFNEDPRYGFVVLSEIASRALSPAVNDPGTAMVIISALTRLFDNWEREKPVEEQTVEFDRIAVPELSLDDLFDDAFDAIARDGAGSIEVMLRLQKALTALATINQNFRDTAEKHQRLALRYAQNALSLPEELARLESK